MSKQAPFGDSVYSSKMLTGVHCMSIWFSIYSYKVQCCLDFVFNNLKQFDFKQFFYFCFNNKTQSFTADLKLIKSVCREWTRIVNSGCVWIRIPYWIQKMIKRSSQNSMCIVYQTLLFPLIFILNGRIKTCSLNNYNLCYQYTDYTVA